MSETDSYSLSRLHDIVEPAAVSSWPPAVGAWLLAGIVLAWALAVAWIAWRRHRAHAYRREALHRLQALPTTTDAATLLAEVDSLLKRVAMASFGRRHVAPMSGRAWLDFLDRTGGDGAFRRTPVAHLANASFKPGLVAGMAENERAEVIAAACRWVRGHRAERTATC